MKEVINRTLLELDVANPITGEVFKVSGTNEESSKYYSIKRITSRINAMDLFSIMEKTCKSSKDISVLNILLETADDQNKIRIDNISKLSEELSISRVKLTKFLKILVDNRLLNKLDTGIYLVNPLVFVGRRVRSNKLREEAQSQWEQLNEEE